MTLWRLWPLWPFLWCAALSGWAEDYEPEYLDAEDPLVIDIEDSLDFVDSPGRRLSFGGDLRGGFFDTQLDLRDGDSVRNDEVVVRLRYGANLAISDYARAKARLAVTCRDDACNPDVDLLSSTTGRAANTDHGDIVFDELYLDLFRRDRLDVVLGRIQTRAVTRGGVFISSLSRLTSPNVSINWTDGTALRYRPLNGWNSTFIAQYNDEDGSSTLARRPLDFSSSDSRVSAFYSVENLQPWGLVTQRAFDLVYMPSSLRKTAETGGAFDDYQAVVGRFAAQWPLRPDGPSLIASGELGYAPQTPERIGRSGDAGGVAWHMEVSWMNVRPGHSVGVNYAHTESGWLLSPAYRPNEETFVVRYHWRPVGRLQMELQGRWREDLDQLPDTKRKRQEFDWRLRFTWRIEPRGSGTL